MNILILGGGGFVGQKLARGLATRGGLRGQPITGLTLADVVDPAPVAAPFAVQRRRCDIADAASVAAVLDGDVDVIFLLAAVVSAHAEADLDAGMATNMMGMLNVLERCRALGHVPVLVFSSSISVYGGAVPRPDL